MKEINQYIKNNFLPDKSEKSLLRILQGARTQQTYFDAMMQDLLPLYELNPNISFETVEQIIRTDYHKTNDKQLYPFFYYATELSFISLVLLVQTVSHYLHQSSFYQPSTNKLFVQQQIKRIFIKMKQKNDFITFAKEIDHLTQFVEDKCGTTFFIHMLYGYDINASSIEGLARQFDLSYEKVQSQLFIEKNCLMHALKNNDYIYLNQIYVRTPLHLNTEETYRLLQKGIDIATIEKLRKIRRHTIEDHIIEIIIKDYPLDSALFISDDEYLKIRAILIEHKFGKLKKYFDISPIKDYFKLKLAIALYKQEVYSGGH